MELVRLRKNKQDREPASGACGSRAEEPQEQSLYDQALQELALHDLAQSEHPDGRGARRDFLKSAATFSLGSMTLTVLGCNDTPKHEEKKGGPVFGFLVDVNRCVGTGKCLTACRAENRVPAKSVRTWVERYIHFKDGTLKIDLVPEVGYSEGKGGVDPKLVEKSYFVPKLCNQCKDAPCHQVCPTHASLKSPEGVELIDPEHCIGCAYCVQACPYGIRFMNPDTGYADKCDWCYHRTTKGGNPGCVEACPTGARLFGRLDDPNSEISQRLASVPTSVLKEHLGAHPVLKYVALPGDVI
jgi:Fe-S-cluster-containing dehydrogenase component